MACSWGALWREPSGRGDLLAAVSLAACGTVHRVVEPTVPPVTGSATITGQVSWPDCPGGGANCPSVVDIPVHFAHAAANQTYTAVSDRSGRYSVLVGGQAFPVISVASAPTGSTFNQAMFVPSGGLSVPGGTARATAGGVPAAAASSAQAARTAR
jgi:hypothetical protein